ncbi:hypothetical protein [Cupriavidus metallidurans]|uniref:hypothetical protein n=1 Tax=Cupriavidus metallidurans TaxID=119219 RepID=UPI001319D41A|nr:hypothetical protein [Cupriavidus metallidurans]
MKKLLCIAAVFVLAACGKAEEPKAAQSSPQLTSQDAVPAAPPKPTHLYSLEEEGEYGYEPGLSEDERKAGKAASALIMVRYLGVKDGTHTVLMAVGNGATDTFSCKSPCEFIKSRIAVNGQVIKSETVRNPGNAVISAVMIDAMNGQLKPYRSSPRL